MQIICRRVHFVQERNDIATVRYAIDSSNYRRPVDGTDAYLIIVHVLYSELLYAAVNVLVGIRFASHYGHVSHSVYLHIYPRVQ